MSAHSLPNRYLVAAASAMTPTCGMCFFPELSWRQHWIGEKWVWWNIKPFSRRNLLQLIKICPLFPCWSQSLFFVLLRNWVAEELLSKKDRLSGEGKVGGINAEYFKCIYTRLALRDLNRAVMAKHGNKVLFQVWHWFWSWINQRVCVIFPGLALPSRPAVSSSLSQALHFWKILLCPVKILLKNSLFDLLAGKNSCCFALMFKTHLKFPVARLQANAKLYRCGGSLLSFLLVTGQNVFASLSLLNRKRVVKVSRVQRHKQLKVWIVFQTFMFIFILKVCLKTNMRLPLIFQRAWATPARGAAPWQQLQRTPDPAAQAPLSVWLLLLLLGIPHSCGTSWGGTRGSDPVCAATEQTGELRSRGCRCFAPSAALNKTTAPWLCHLTITHPPPHFTEKSLCAELQHWGRKMLQIASHFKY